MKPIRESDAVRYIARMRLTIVTWLIWTAGCMTSTTTESRIGSCATSGGQACIEYTNASSEALERDAEPNCQGTWRLEACARANVIGGCTTEVTGPYGAVTVTTWFYSGTAADVMARCAQIGETFVPA